jgi:hypothetical protein
MFEEGYLEVKCNEPKRSLLLFGRFFKICDDPATERVTCKFFHLQYFFFPLLRRLCVRSLMSL